MSVCSPCYDAGSYVNACLTQIVYNVGLADDTYYISVQHNATQKIQQFEVVSDGGFILIDGVQLDPLQGYTIWVTQCENCYDHLDLTIDTETYKCISFSAASVGLNPILIP
jgi:hypothetical protein